MIRLLILIRSLEVGGAERQLVELVKALDRGKFFITVATFYDRGRLRAELVGLPNVRVVSLGKKGRWDIGPFLWRLWKVARRARPHIVYGNMGIANELSLLVGRIVRARVVWSLRASNVDFSQYGWASGFAFKIGALLSRFPDLIIANSHAGRVHHIAQGYVGKRMLVISNGIDTDLFKPDRSAGQGVRTEWGVDSQERLVGLVGRVDPMKDHPTFLRAAELLSERAGHVRFVCVGDGPAAYKDELRRLATELRLSDKIIWAGARSDMRAVYNALDVLCSSSTGEGLPNAVAEAMACGIPCVVTDVGDSARLVGNPNQVVPPQNPQALSEAIGRVLILSDSQRRTLGRQGRERILAGYSVQQLAAKTEAALLRVLE
jgi:glycosyltransferase involved in cell wall biosynthesis